MMLKNKILEEISQIKKTIWAGQTSPFECDCIDIENSSNYRVSAGSHGRYESVWIYEKLLSNISGWKYYLDECIRLLDESGYLIIRTQENENVNIIKLKRFLFRNKLISNVEVIHESETKCPEHGRLVKHERELTLVFHVTRRYTNSYNNRSWSFGIVTQGSKVDNVVKFCSKIREYENTESEIIILGPKNDAYSHYNVRYLSDNFSEEYAEISKKKNSIVSSANHENILIAHDRYMINDNFFSGFEKYGYDFDFLTIKQYYSSGNVFPGYLNLAKKMVWSQIYYLDDERHSNDSTFINGGLFILKKSLAKEIGFNSIIYWDQGEDVEYASTMLVNGVCPRVNLFSSATTIGIDEAHTSTFRPLNPKVPSKKIIIGSQNGVITRTLKRYTPLKMKVFIKGLLK